MAILVTGGYGHVGSWVCRQLLRQGHEVVLVDIAQRSYGYLDEATDALKVVIKDVSDFAGLVDGLSIYKDDLEGIIHVAGLVASDTFYAQPYTHARTHVLGTLNIMELARVFDIPRVTYISSGAVYGSSRGILKEDQPYTPSDLYGACKVAAESMVCHGHEHFGIDIRSARIYFVYGAGRFPSMQPPLYRAIFGPLEGLQHVYTPNGADQLVDWTYVEDAARGIVMLHKAEDPAHRVYNISAGKLTGVAEMVATVRKYATVDARVKIGPGMALDRGGPLDISRAKADFGFEPVFTIDQGIQSYARWLEAEG